MQNPPAYLVMAPAASGDDTAQITAAYANAASRPVMMGAGTFNVDCSQGEINIPDGGVVVGPWAYSPDESQSNNPNFTLISRLTCKTGTHPASGRGVVRLNNNNTLSGFQITADLSGNRAGDCADAVSTRSPRLFRMLLGQCNAAINHSSDGSRLVDGISIAQEAWIDHNTLQFVNYGYYANIFNSGSGISDDQITSNEIEVPFTQGIFASNAAVMYIDGNRIEDGGGVAVTLDNANSVTVTNNLTNRMGLLNLTGSTYHLKVSGNHITGAGGSPSFQYGMTLSSSSGGDRLFSDNFCDIGMDACFLVNGSFTAQFNDELIGNHSGAPPMFFDARTEQTLSPLVNNTLVQYDNQSREDGWGLQSGWTATNATLALNQVPVPYAVNNIGATVTESSDGSPQVHYIQRPSFAVNSPGLSTFTLIAARNSGTRDVSLQPCDSTCANYAEIFYDLSACATSAGNNVTGGLVSIKKQTANLIGAGGGKMFCQISVTYDLGVSDSNAVVYIVNTTGITTRSYTGNGTASNSYAFPFFIGSSYSPSGVPQ